MLYPLKFKPILKTPLWGGVKLRDMLNKEGDFVSSGESWEISCIEGNESIVANGYLEGNSLSEIIEVYMGDLVGQKIFEKFETNFPLLFKFIDAGDDLSIQVHPDDETALERHNSFGKTEMWYILQADNHAELVSGFNSNITPEIYKENLENNTLDRIINKVSVNPDDVFFIPAGRVHSIGKGILLAEIQQSSNITYRIFDFNRVDSNGNQRELHTELAVDVIDYKFPEQSKILYPKLKNQPVNLVDCRYFTTNVIELTETIERDMMLFDSFVVYMALEGESELIYNDNKTELLKKGETILMPAVLPFYQIRPVKYSKLLEIYIAHNENDNGN